MLFEYGVFIADTIYRIFGLEKKIIDKKFVYVDSTFYLNQTNKFIL